MKAEGSREKKMCSAPQDSREARGHGWFPQKADRTWSGKRGEMSAGYGCRLAVEP